MSVQVLIVDDSAIVREILAKRLEGLQGIHVAGVAPDPFVARQKLETIPVDVITLDIEMPRMDGLTFLKYLMKYDPKPVIIVSSLADKTNRASMQALELGAVEIVPKPGGPYSVDEVIDSLATKILAAAAIPAGRLRELSTRVRERYPARGHSRLLSGLATTRRLVLVGASTGGTIALEALFSRFKPEFPPALTVIHMPERFTRSFAQRLDDICPVRVKEAEDGEKVMPATVYIAPGNLHMRVEARGTDRIIRTGMGPRIFGQRPAVDVLFQSAAEAVGKNAIALLLTGMGRDGAAGLLEIRRAGGWTIAQDEASSTIFGMPKAAIDLGAAMEVLPLDAMPDRIRAILAEA
jgi:two-component system chemotaxis response regulator CheB